MCTVSVIPCREPSTVRLACNRDEQVYRAEALPPAILRLGGRRVIFPVDPVSGGTWIAATDSGLAMALLNVNDGAAARRSRTPTSRGVIIPSLATAGSLAVAVLKAVQIEARQFLPFRVVIADRNQLAEIASDGLRMRVVCLAPLSGPMLFTSSALGDALVDVPRRRLFEHFLWQGANGPCQQEAFHRHHWPSQSHLSVCMERPDARTVSYTAVTLLSDQIQMDYRPNRPNQCAEKHVIILPLARGGVR